jgi:hypothetical protein
MNTRFSAPTRFLLTTIGVDVARAARCPAAEVRRMLWLAWLIIAIWVWQLFIYTAALHIALSPGRFRPDLLLVAGGFSTLLQIVELSLFVRPIWDEHADASREKMEGTHA